MVASPLGDRLRRLWRRLAQRLMYRAPAERNDCPACGSPALADLDVLPLRAARTGFVSVCDGCGLVFSNPLPSSEDLADFYSPSGAWAIERPRVEDEPSGPPRRIGGTWTRMFDAIRGELDVSSPPPGARVLDFGCGEGNLLDRFQDCGWETYGIEPALDRAFRRHRRLDVIPREATFDLVAVMQVLEHVPNPLRLLQQLAGACRIGGYLVVSVPRFDTLPLHRDYRYVLNGRAHITAYTWSCLRTLLARSGWEPVAPPPDEVPKGGGRRTRSRLRVLARRVDGALPEVRRPGDDARAALRGFYAQGDSRPRLARAGLLRMAALQADRRRRRAKAARKTAKHDAIPGPTPV